MFKGFKGKVELWNTSIKTLEIEDMGCRARRMNFNLWLTFGLWFGILRA